MTLIQFSDSVGATQIKAADLDANFARVRPAATDGTGRQYAITDTGLGWQMTIFPEGVLPSYPTVSGAHNLQVNSRSLAWIPAIPPPPSGAGPFILGAQNGQYVWLQTTECSSL